MAYCTFEDVVNMSGVKAKTLGFTNESDGEFYALITEWISQAESFIDSYCRKNWKDYTNDKGEQVIVTVPPVVKNVCIRLTSNIIAFYFKRREDPIRKVNDYSVKVFESDVFTDDLKEDLKPFRKSSRVSVFRI